MPLYDGFILDQFGVMHNGQSALPGAVETVKELAEQGKKLIILSNTSSVSESALAKLPKLGFDPEHFEGAVTSGGEASEHIKNHYQGKKALLFTWASNKASKNFISQCGSMDLAHSVDDADYVIAHGTEVWRKSVNDEDEFEGLGNLFESGDMSIVDEILNECKARKLVMINVNPDLITVRPDGSHAYMPGTISKSYEDMGGEVVYFGKPHVEHFHACIQVLEEKGLDRDRIVHVGDSLHHDIKGANEAGIASVFVASGVHGSELGIEAPSTVEEDTDFQLPELPPEEKLQELFEKEGQVPTHVVPLLTLDESDEK